MQLERDLEEMAHRRRVQIVIAPEVAEDALAATLQGVVDRFHVASHALGDELVALTVETGEEDIVVVRREDVFEEQAAALVILVGDECLYGRAELIIDERVEPARALVVLVNRDVERELGLESCACSGAQP